MTDNETPLGTSPLRHRGRRTGSAVERARAKLDAALATGGLDQPIHLSWDDGRHPNLRRLVCDLI